MGTFERGYEVDGERFELYAQADDGEASFQLVDGDNLAIGEPFAVPPDDETVVDLVRAIKALNESAA